MYLWDTNIVRHFGEGHPTLHLYLERISWSEIALPSVVVAEVLRGCCDFALKAIPSKAPLAHRFLLETQQILSRFNVVVFDKRFVNTLEELLRKHKTHKQYTDIMIAAMAKAGKHIVVTRNKKH
ncbi:MAG: tRNA(fMet)-specific endonuclease VapC, partial [Acidobacteriota bacterium]|nr:tRNA(fMet)-specific endonuclease VapC [Acidobacteriota bacterium]